MAVLQGLIDGGLALIEARKVMYADQMAEGRTLVVVDEAAETAAIAEGFSEHADRISTEFPKTLYHSGYPTGGATGMMVEGKAPLASRLSEGATSLPFWPVF